MASMKLQAAYKALATQCLLCKMKSRKKKHIMQGPVFHELDLFTYMHATASCHTHSFAKPHKHLLRAASP